MIEVFGYQIERWLFWAIIGIGATVFFGLVTLFAWILPRKAKLHPKEKETIDHLKKKIETIEKEAKEANENIKLIEEKFGIKPYVDGLTSAPRPVFDPFFEGTKLMTVYKWDKAISEFQKAMKEAQAKQLVALFNLIGLCYSTLGRPSLALENYEESLRLARQFTDNEGEANALGNLGLIYEDRGNLDQALKYHQESLKIDKEIGYREGEASNLCNVGLIYRHRGDLDQTLKYIKDALKIHTEIGFREGEASALDQALKYIKDALKIHTEIGFREGEASALGNIGNVYYLKGDLDQALKYLNEALKIFEEIGMPEQIGIVKGNIERISQQMKQMKK